MIIQLSFLPIKEFQIIIPARQNATTMMSDQHSWYSHDFDLSPTCCNPAMLDPLQKSWNSSFRDFNIFILAAYYVHFFLVLKVGFNYE
jgi:hypothetical protein